MKKPSRQGANIEFGAIAETKLFTGQVNWVGCRYFFDSKFYDKFFGAVQNGTELPKPVACKITESNLNYRRPAVGMGADLFQQII